MLVAASFLVLLAAPAAFALGLDVFAAQARELWRHLVLAAFCVALSGPALAMVLYTRKKWMRTAWLATWALLLLLGFVPWHPRKQFASDLFSIEPGMTVDQVEGVMGHYMKGAGKKWVVPPEATYAAPTYPVGAERLHATGMMTYRWNDTDAAYDSDWGQVTFNDGRVVSVAFLPD